MSNVLLTGNVVSRRSTYFVYHPAAHSMETYEDVRARFENDFNKAREIARIYNEENPNTPLVYSEEVVREIGKMLEEIDKIKDIYLLEALSEYLYPDHNEDHNRKFQKSLPYFEEVKKKALEIRAEDIGIKLEDRSHIIKPVKRIIT